MAVVVPDDHADRRRGTAVSPDVGGDAGDQRLTGSRTGATGAGRRLDRRRRRRAGSGERALGDRIRGRRSSGDHAGKQRGGRQQDADRRGIARTGARHVLDSRRLTEDSSTVSPEALGPGGFALARRATRAWPPRPRWYAHSRREQSAPGRRSSARYRRSALPKGRLTLIARQALVVLASNACADALRGEPVLGAPARRRRLRVDPWRRCSLEIRGGRRPVGRAPSRARARSRQLPPQGRGTRTATARSRRNSLASLRSSRRSVSTRSPGSPLRCGAAPRPGGDLRAAPAAPSAVQVPRWRASHR